MKRKINIHNLDSLEREIYRLKLEARLMEEKLDRNLDHLEEHYLSMTMNSFFCRDEQKDNGNTGFWKGFFKNDGVHSAMNTIAGNIAAKAAEGINDWLNKFFSKNKN